MFKRLLKTKTFWSGIAGIVGAGAGYYTGEMESVQAIQLAVGCILAVFIRDGVAKK